MFAQLVVIDGPDRGQLFQLAQGEPLLVGRSRANGARLGDPRVSRIHCQVEFDGSRAVVTDWESTGGTAVNGRKVERAVLDDGDIIQVGGTRLRLVCGDLDGEPTVASESLADDPVLERRLGELREARGGSVGDSDPR